MLEKQIESRLVDLCKRYGGIAIKLTGYRGIPDRIILNRFGQVMFVELKRPGKHLRENQIAWQKKLQGMGFKSVMVDSFISVDALKSFLSGV